MESLTHPGATLVARREEVAALDAFVADPGAGFAALVLEGGAGIGKTTLWRYATAHAAELGLLVLGASPTAAEAHLAFAGIGDLLRPRFADLGERLPAPQRRALAVALMLAEPGDEAAEPYAIAAGLLGFLQELARAAPLVLAIDDVQWLDPSSASAIAFATRRLRDEPVRLLLGHRRERPGPLPLELERSAAPDRVGVLPVGPLSFGATHALVDSQLGDPPPRPVLRRIHEISGGNPLFALELAAAVREAGEGLERGQRPPVPESLQELVHDRVRRLPERTRDALTAAAALGEPTVGKIARFDPDASPWESLRPAADAGLIAFERERIRFAHPIYAAAVYELADPGARRAIHERLAVAVAEPGERAAHLARATDRPDAGIARELARAAEQAAARGASEAAVELAEHARRLMPSEDAAERAGITLAASDYSFAAGDTSGARRLLAEFEDSEDPNVRAGALVRLCTITTFDGTVAEAQALARRALAEPVDELALAVAVHRRASLVAMLGNRIPEAEATATRAVELAHELGDPGTLAPALASLAFLRACLRLPGWEEAIDHAVALAQQHRTGLIDDSPGAIKGLLLFVAGDLAGSRAYLEAELSAAVERGGDPLATSMLFALSGHCTRAGRFDEALELADRGLAAAEQSRQHLQRGALLYGRALALAHVGREEEAVGAAREGLEISERAGHVWAGAENLWALGLSQLWLGRNEEALESLTRAIEAVRAGGVREIGIVPAHADAVEAALAVGRPELAEDFQRELEEEGEAPWLRAAALRSRGLMRAAAGDLEGALQALGRSVSEDRELGEPFALARARLALGATLRRAKRKRRAREELETARADFEALRSPRWARRAEEELARVSGRAPAGDELTATERRVADLVAAGRSNKQVAADLFVSVRAVEANLTRIYAKLGLRSRTQLARALGAADAD